MLDLIKKINNFELRNLQGLESNADVCVCVCRFVCVCVCVCVFQLGGQAINVTNALCRRFESRLGCRELGPKAAEEGGR